MPRSWKQAYLLSGSHLLFIEWLKHLRPWQTWLRGVSPVSREQITKGMGERESGGIKWFYICHVVD